MGAWGVRPFENDDASDFIYQVDADGVDAILAGLDGAATADYCEADQGAQAVAGAALVAAARDGQEDLLSREAAEALAGVRDAVLAKAGLVKLARRALRNVRGPGSELAELWSDGEDLDAWNGVIDDLMERLSD